MENGTLIAGLGNVLLGDEGIGVHAVRLLTGQGLPAGVDAVDAGTALGDLLGVLQGYRRLILVDAVRGGGRPGELYRLEIRARDDLLASARPLSLHEFGVAEALDQARALGVLPAQVVLIGMEPESLAPAMEPSETCARALPELLHLIRAEVAK